MKDDTVEELRLLSAQRAQLASRLKTPWWYIAGIALASGVAYAMPIGSRYLTGAGLGSSLLAIAVFYLLQLALARVSGVAIGTRTLQYPSGRAWGIAFIAIIIPASVGETLLLNHGLLAAAIAVGVVATLVGTACWLGHIRGIRRDLATGTGAA